MRLIVLLLILLISGCYGEKVFEIANVSKVIDGDTILLENGEKVRLLGINTPEKKQHGYIEAKEFLREVVENKTVKLERDVSNRDKYGRLLRYVYVNDIFVNLELIKRGYANSYFVEPNVKYKKEFKKEEKEVMISGMGIWSGSGKRRCIDLVYFKWNAEGNDCDNLNDEYFVLRNKCDDINMKGWIIKDESTHVYVFKDFILKKNSDVVVYSGCGKDSEDKLYWCGKGKCGAIWNNDGDTLYIFDNNNKLVLRYGY